MEIPQAAIANSITSAASMRRRRSGAGASAANNAKLRIHSGDPSIFSS